MRNRESGSFFLSAIFVVGALCLIGSAVYFFGSSSSQSSAGKDPATVFNFFQKRLEAALANQQALNSSVAKNESAFACLYSSNADCTGKGGLFQLYEKAEASAQPFSQLGTDTGLTMDGIGCRGFPSAACPFRIEAHWLPVCSPTGCTNTVSMNFQVSLKYQSDVLNSQPLDWDTKILFVPQLQLSQSTLCERQGNIWDGKACVSYQQAESERRIASEPRQGAPGEQAPVVYACPGTVTVQGQDFQVEPISNTKAQVHVPASNGCPNAFDTFIFTCGPTGNPRFENEGNWVQTETTLAPACDESGHSVQQQDPIAQQQAQVQAQEQGAPPPQDPQQYNQENQAPPPMPFNVEPGTVIVPPPLPPGQ